MFDCRGRMVFVAKIDADAESGFAQQKCWASLKRTICEKSPALAVIFNLLRFTKPKRQPHLHKNVQNITNVPHAFHCEICGENGYTGVNSK